MSAKTPTPELKISIYDPGVDAYREVPVSVAEKFVEASKKVEAQLAELKNGTDK